jgi:hypothetical protein
MASIGKKTGRKGVSYSVRFFRNGERQMVYLGQMPERGAIKIKGHVEDLISAAAGGVSVTPATSAWLSMIDDALAKSLADVGLIVPRKTEAEQSASTLGPFIDSYLAQRTDVKPRTKDNLTQAKRWLVEYFGAEKPLAESRKATPTNGGAGLVSRGGKPNRSAKTPYGGTAAERVSFSRPQKNGG